MTFRPSARILCRMKSVLAPLLESPELPYYVDELARRLARERNHSEEAPKDLGRTKRSFHLCPPQIFGLVHGEFPRFQKSRVRTMNRRVQIFVPPGTKICTWEN